MIVAGSSFLASLAALLVGLFLGTALDTLGIFIAVSTLAYSLPALWEGMRSTSTAGLSLLALAVNTVEAAIYFVGGIGGGGIVPAGQVVPGYIFFGAIAALSNFPRLLRVALRRVRKLDGG
jgi:hypothetical protein